jgi:hypothetical protein
MKQSRPLIGEIAFRGFGLDVRTTRIVLSRKVRRRKVFGERKGGIVVADPTVSRD